MDPIAALIDQQSELSDLLAGCTDADWQRTSRCEGWTVADVVLHLAQTNELALASVQGRLAAANDELASDMRSAQSVDEGADAMVARERGQSPLVIRDRWQTGADALVHAFRTTDPHARVIWVAGELSARTLATTRLAETWIHTDDVAAAFGRDPAPTDRLWHVARLAWRTLPYAFDRAGRTLTGPVAFALRAPNGDAWDFVPDTSPRTTIRGDAVELCLVAARRVDPADTGLVSDGPDGPDVLELLRTYA